jgi:hypothetical protein
MPIVRAEPERIRSQRDDAVLAAQQLIDKHDYEAAVKLLEQIPPPLRKQQVNEVLDQATKLNARCRLLIQQITLGFKRHDPDKLLPKVERLLELRPHFDQAREWYFHLTGKQYGEAEKRSLPPVVFWPAAAAVVLAVAGLGYWLYQQDWDGAKVADGVVPQNVTANRNNGGGDGGNRDNGGNGKIKHDGPQVLKIDPAKKAGFRPVDFGKKPSTKKQVTPQPSPADSLQVVDLMKLIDPAKHAIIGTWRISGTDLVPAGASVRFLQIPYTPPQEYEIHLEFTRPKSGDRNPVVMLGLIAGGRSFQAVFDQRRRENGLYCLDNIPRVRRNKSYRRLPSFGDDKRIDLRCRVTKSGVRATVDGRVAIDWSGAFTRLTLDKIAISPNLKQLTLRCHGPYRFHTIELRPLSAEPQIFEPTPQPIPGIEIVGRHEYSRLVIGDRQTIGNKKYDFDKIPDELKDRAYSKSINFGATLNFKVTKPTKVIVGFLHQAWAKGGRSRWINVSDLQKAGWKPYPVTPPLTCGRFSWDLFTRDCKAGESFAFRNHNYNQPILIAP